MKKLRKKDDHKITAALLCGLYAFIAMYGLVAVVGGGGVVSFGLAVFGMAMFSFVCVPLIDHLIIFFGMKIIERQNKEKS